MTSQSHSPLAEPKPTPRALGPNRHLGRKAQPCACARAKFRKKKIAKISDYFGPQAVWTQGCGQKAVDTKLWTHGLWTKGLWTQGCGQNVVDTKSQSCGHNGHKVVDTNLWTKSCGHNVAEKVADKLADTLLDTRGHLRTNLRTHADKVVDTRGQVADKVVDKCGQTCGHTRTKLWTHADKLRTKSWTHADKLVDACGQSCGRMRTKWRTLWFRTVRFGCQTLGIFGVSLNC